MVGGGFIAWTLGYHCLLHERGITRIGIVNFIKEYRFVLLDKDINFYAKYNFILIQVIKLLNLYIFWNFMYCPI